MRQNNKKASNYSQEELQALLDNAIRLENIEKAQKAKLESQRLANRRYLHKKKALELGMTVEEYEEKKCKRGRPKVYENNVIDLSNMEVEEVEIEEPVEAIVMPSVEKKRKGRPKKKVIE
jgi:hypothetical protein